MKEKQIIVRCTDKFKNQVRELADGEGLTLSAYITRLIKLQINGKEKKIKNIHKSDNRRF